MAGAQLGSVLHHLRGACSATSDSELLERFCARRDETAFTQMLRRHGPMVIGIGRRVLRQEADAEDVFQATFLLLARKASTIRKAESVGSWLHGVAHHLALKARSRAARRKAHEGRAAEMRDTTATAQTAWQELREVLDEALRGLPEHHRAVLLLCYLEGRTQEEAARQLGCPLGTVRSRLARARKLLQGRLTRRGLALSATALVTALSANGARADVPARLLKSTLKAGLQFANGGAAPGLVPAAAARLAEEGLKTLFAGKAKALAALVLVLGLFAGGIGVLAEQQRADPQPAATPADAPRAAAKAADGQADAPPAKKDGDPLPAGATARLGTVRLRQGTNVTAISFSPDAKQLVSGNMDQTLCLWDVATGKKLRQFEGDEGGGSMVAFSPDGKLVAAAGLDGVVYLWDATSWKTRRHELKVPGESFYSLAFSADSTALAAGTAKGTVFVWDTTTAKERARLEGHQSYVRCVAFAPDGKTLASGGDDDKTARLWDLVAGKELHQLKGHGGPVVGLAFAPDGKTVATGAFVGWPPDEPLRVWDVVTGKEVRQIKGGPPHGFCRLALTADGKTLISGGEHSLRSYDWATGKELRRYGDDGHGDVGGFIALSADGKTLASAIGAAIRQWATDTGKEVLPSGSGGHRAEVQSVAFAPDGRTLASGGKDDAVCLWDAAAGKELRRLPLEPRQSPSALAFSPDGQRLAAGTHDGKVRFWESATGKESPPSLELNGRMPVVAFSPDGKSLISRELDGTVRVWDAAARKEVRAFKGAPGLMTSMAVSPDGKLLASGGDDGAIRTWDVAAGKELRRWQGHGNEGGANWVAALAFSPDGATLVSGGGDSTVRLWDVAGGTELMRSDREKKGHTTRGVASLAFSPNGRMFASGNGDHTVRLWEVAARQERHRFEGHAGGVHAVAFTGDGKTVASASADTTVLLWDATGRPAAPPPARLGAGELKTLWADLASKDAKEAFAAVGTLVLFPAQAVPLLESGLRVVPPADPKRLARLLADLESEAFEARAKAAKELEELGDAAEPYLRQALAGKPGIDARRTLQLLSDGLEGRAERLRATRALEVLEYVGTAEARQLLRALAKGAPEAWLTREAKAAAERLDKLPHTRTR